MPSAMRPLMPGDLVLGEALLCDVYGDKEVLLLRRGNLISSEQMLIKMMERGVYVDEQDYALFPSSKSSPESTVSVDEARSSLRLVLQSHRQLDLLLADLCDGMLNEDTLKGLEEIAQAVSEAVEVNADVALAATLFRQNAEGYSAFHSVSTAIVALLIAKSMQKSDAEIASIVGASLTMNASLHRLQDTLQSSASGPTPEEAELIRRHPEASAALLKQIGVDDPNWIDYVLHHHENIDGSGYPSRKMGSSIPENAKLIAIADRYTALIAPRRYRPSILPGEALRNMLMDRGKGVDETLAANLIRMLGIYPPGTFVKLASGEIGVVTKRTKNSKAPIVHALLGPRGSPLPFPHKRETEHERYAIREAVRPDWTLVSFNMQQIWGKEASE